VFRCVVFPGPRGRPDPSKLSPTTQSSFRSPAVPFLRPPTDCLQSADFASIVKADHPSRMPPRRFSSLWPTLHRARFPAHAFTPTADPTTTSRLVPACPSVLRPPISRSAGAVAPLGFVRFAVPSAPGLQTLDPAVLRFAFRDSRRFWLACIPSIALALSGLLPNPPQLALLRIRRSLQLPLVFDRSPVPPEHRSSQDRLRALGG
jgi:hypothetical protein